jgi:tetratricopeptide (TPR) repeat protein
MVLRMEDSLSARRALDALLSTPGTSAPAASVAPIATPLVSSAAARERTKAAVEPAPPVAAKQAVPPIGAAPTKPAQADSTAIAQRQHQAGGDAMAQAQSLWNTGSHDAAIDLMQQSIAAAERAPNAGSVLIPLARELARMQLAEGRFGAVWEMLTRLEPQLGNQPDLWAIRANAAQRLGRHQDSVHAYMVALQSRPDEQRWLLGTAVSLAALGQTSSASEMAEKARAVGPIGKDILTFLRQAGVIFRD